MRFDHRPSTEALLAAIDAERDRRLAAGFVHDFGGAIGAHRIATTPADLDGWARVTALAQAMMLAGDDSASIEIVTETGAARVTPAQWNAAMLAWRREHEQPILLAAIRLRAMRPPPQDAALPAHWPA
ncbi:hypothetical protein [Rhizobium sp. G21]|uniref:DUF4376 domain-containing protein n=1 Tax=Rhizobium sp. G21 TaxID=2758439 RepID=UPI001601FF3D|nr:hypothetical protein [Rhizobium sp. G21]MBB1247472.1 hypothetical protein [Rhizobium sp. G21]